MDKMGTKKERVWSMRESKEEDIDTFIIKKEYIKDIAKKVSEAIKEEKNLVINIPKEDLPLYINYVWIFLMNEELYNKRLKGIQ